jgi:hypothetical protein
MKPKAGLTVTRGAVGLTLLLVTAVAFGLLVRRAPRQAIGLTDLPSLEALQARFDQDQGAIRIVLLLSPT